MWMCIRTPPHPHVVGTELAYIARRITHIEGDFVAYLAESSDKMR